MITIKNSKQKINESFTPICECECTIEINLEDLQDAKCLGKEDEFYKNLGKEIIEEIKGGLK